MSECREVLEALVPAIEKIDGGCSGWALDNFVTRANRGLEKINSPYRLKGRLVRQGLGPGSLSAKVQVVSVFQGLYRSITTGRRDTANSEPKASSQDGVFVHLCEADAQGEDSPSKCLYKGDWGHWSYFHNGFFICNVRYCPFCGKSLTDLSDVKYLESQPEIRE